MPTPHSALSTLYLLSTLHSTSVGTSEPPIKSTAISKYLPIILLELYRDLTPWTQDSFREMTLHRKTQRNICWKYGEEACFFVFFVVVLQPVLNPRSYDGARIFFFRGFGGRGLEKHRDAQVRRDMALVRGFSCCK